MRDDTGFLCYRLMLHIPEKPVCKRKFCYEKENAYSVGHIYNIIFIYNGRMVSYVYLFGMGSYAAVHEGQKGGTRSDQ